MRVFGGSNNAELFAMSTAEGQQVKEDVFLGLFNGISAEELIYSFCLPEDLVYRLLEVFLDENPDVGFAAARE